LGLRHARTAYRRAWRCRCNSKPELFRKKYFAEASLVVLTVGGAFGIRALHLDERPFWVDEAESSINALTILEHGYPTDTYLGLPTYENTLVQRWPGNAEYEFRDVSYSDNHFAVYHGWLPLYAMAASFVAHGIQPDLADESRAVKHDLSERKRRTRAARLPAVFFGALFLLIVFAGGATLYGRDAAWTALIVGSIYPFHLALSRQARYYSAEVTLTTACSLALWLLIRDCRWKYVYFASLALVLLFHTHLLSFCAAALVLLIFVPAIIRQHEAAIRKLITLAALVIAGTLPWVIVTGFHSHQSRIPRAWTLLEFPSDFWRYPPFHWHAAVPGIAITLLTAWLVRRKPRVSPRIMAPALRFAPALLFLGVWAACGYATFVTLVPAVSFDTGRLNLSYWGPMFLLGSIACAAIARVLAPRHSLIVAPVVTFVLFFATGHTLNFNQRFSGGDWRTDAVVFDHLGAMHLEKSTKLYAAPNDHLILTFYSGLPVQDITPVRKSYLDLYRGDIVYIDRSISVDADLLTPESIQRAALRNGYTMAEQDARKWSVLLGTRDYREAALKTCSPGSVGRIEPSPAFGQQLLSAHHKKLLSVFSNPPLELVTRGFDMRSWTDWRVLLKYRFIDPKAHSGSRANYAERLRGSDAIILARADTAIYRSRWHPANICDPIAFTFVW
jgi:hypothetical protein